MLKIETKGSCEQRGYQQAEACRHIALPYLNGCLDKLAKKLSASSRAGAVEMVKSGIDKLCNQFKNVNPHTYQESCALAQGLGLDYHEYFAAMFTGRLKVPNCTTLGFHDKSKKPYVVKTDDILEEERGMNVLEISSPNQGYKSAHFHFAGTCWTVAGMNECGLTIAMTGIPGPTLETQGQQSVFALSSILPNCKNVEDAIGFINRQKINGYGFSLLLGDPDGNLELIEKNGMGMSKISLNEYDTYVHTNVILDDRLIAKSTFQEASFLENTKKRYENATRLSSEIAKNEEGIKKFLKNRSSVGAICQKGEAGLHTDFGIYLMPTEGKMVYYPGYPTDASPQTILIEEIF